MENIKIHSTRDYYKKDLATELENSRDCKREIFRELKQEFFKEEGGSESSAQPTQQPARQVQTMAGRLNKDMLIASNKSRAGGIRFFDPPLDTVIVNNKMFRADLQFRLPGTYVFRLDRRQQNYRLVCALSDEIRKNARYALRVIGDNNRVFEQYYSIGNDPVSKDVDIAGVETLVFDFGITQWRFYAVLL